MAFNSIEWIRKEKVPVESHKGASGLSIPLNGFVVISGSGTDITLTNYPSIPLNGFLALSTFIP